MLSADPLSSSSCSSSSLFFLQPLSALPSSDNFRLLPTTTTMATSSSSSSVRREMLESTDSSRFPFLESKPSLMDAERGGKGHGKAAKGRRHAGEAILRRKLANQAFLVKVGQGGAGAATGAGSGGGKGGGRRRGRVLAERVAEEFATSVPYSLNRKSRWAKLSGGASWLAEVAARDWSGQGQLRMSLAEADYSLDGAECVRALHSLDAEKGRVESRWAKSSRGAANVGDLMKSPGAASEQENEDPEATIGGTELHFLVQRPHPIARVFAAKYLKRVKTFRSGKRSGVETNTGSGGGRTTIARVVPESEPEEESEFTSQYRPRQETYSLADFVKENSTPPVIVRRPANSDEDEEQFAIVPMLECVPLSPSDSCPDSPSCPSALLLLRNAFRADPGLFLRVPLPTSVSDLSILSSKVQWHPKWVATGVLMLDMSWALAGQGREPEESVLVMVLDGQEMLINGLFPVTDVAKLEHLARSAELGPEQKLEGLLELLGRDHAEWMAKRNFVRTQRQSVRLSQHRSVLHSVQLALTGHVIPVHAIWGRQCAEMEEAEAEEFVVDAEGKEPERAEEDEEADDGQDEEFELIDIQELIEPDGEEQGHRDGRSPSADLSLQCAECARCPAPRLTMLRFCGHRICGECLENGIKEQMAKGETAAQLHCPLCPSPMPLDLLPLVLPLASANSLSLLHFWHNSPRNLLAQCPGCEEILSFGEQPKEEAQNEFLPRHLCCARCSILWCADCDAVPHWPLSCAQNDQWTRKFAQHERCQEVPETKGGGGVIAAQFAEICSEARARRVDVKLGWQLGKHMRRLVDSKAERRFVSARKTALHLLEFGTAWLYLHRQNPRPPAWAQLKSLLWALRDRVECMDNELLFSGSASDVQGLQGRLAELEQLVEKTQQKMGAGVAK